MPQTAPNPGRPAPGGGGPPAGRSGASGAVPGGDSPLEPERFEPAAAILAVLLPGAGHIYLGEVKRGVLIGLGILGLFFGGILIGGIDVIDSREDRIWFFGQALVGPVAFGVDYLHQARFKVIDTSNKGEPRSAAPGETRDPATGRAVPAGPGELPPSSKSIARMNELGTLYATLAGMLNLIAIIDAGLHRRRPGEAT
jgi:TM2 domain-containing membrane protein YozV